jgi:hypothetical protein
MPAEQNKPLIVISYAHADEPEKPAEGEVKWLSFVTGFLRPAIKHGAVDLWIDRLMLGGADSEQETGEKLRVCDIFILLVSRHSLSSDYVVDKEIAIIRERQAKGEDVHFYPLVLTPTPKIALNLVRDTNLRPRDGKPFSEYSINQRYRQMCAVADEIAEIARKTADGNRAAEVAMTAPVATSASAPAPSKRTAAIRDRFSLKQWLSTQERTVIVSIAARAAMRVLPLVVPEAREGSSLGYASHFLSSAFRGTAIARMAAKSEIPAESLRAALTGIAGSTAFGAKAATESAAGAVRAALGGLDGELRDEAAKAVEDSVAAATIEAATALHSAEMRRLGYAANYRNPDTAGAQASMLMWQEVGEDAESAERSGAGSLVYSALWKQGAPDWASAAWNGLKAALPQDENWQVWIDWYDDRLRGKSGGEDYELVFASVPLDVWNQGAAAANAWIRDHLRSSNQGQSVTVPQEIRIQDRLDGTVIRADELKDHPKGRPASELPQPLPDVDSPFTYGWNTKLRVEVVAGAQNLPFYSFFSSEEDHRLTLEACRVTAERLVKDLREGSYGNAVRWEYAKKLGYYLDDLPKRAGVGNILLANDQIIVLRAMLAEDDAVPVPFVADLGRLIAKQAALNGFYDLVRRHEQAVLKGDWSQPFPFEAAKRFVDTVRKNTPGLFEPEVGEGLHRVEEATPSLVAEYRRPLPQEAQAKPVHSSDLPPSATDPEHSRQRQIATAANALWTVFLKGKDLPVAFEGWAQVAHKLGENIGPILHFLRGLGGGGG